MEGFDSVPSPLEEPSHGDAPKREWLDAFGFTLGVGAAWPFGTENRRAPRPLKQRADAPWPTRATDADPIAIELVRGADGVANGGADRWSLLIDGARCDWPAEPGESSDYFLPSPFADAVVDNIAYLAPEDVRPLVIGVRLEAEALEPARVELVVEQAVAHGGEDGGDDGGDNVPGGDGNVPPAEEVVALATQELKPYRPSDTVAHTLAMPYLWCAPAQSTLGIASFAAAKEYEDRLQQAKTLNEALAKTTNATERDRLQKRQQRKAKTIDWQNQLLRERNAALQRDWREAQAAANAREVALGGTTGAGAQAMSDYREPPRSARARAVPALTDVQQDAVMARLKDLPPIPKTGGSKSKTWTFGGGARSAAADLADAVRVLTKTSEWVQANPSARAGSANNFTPFCEHVRAMRNLLLETRKDKALALLDAMLTSTPSPLALVLAEKYFALNEEKTNVQDEPKREDETKRWRNSKRYEFVYERMHHNILAQSATRLQLRLRIHPRDGSAPTEVLIRAPRRSAIAAGAAYRRGDDDFLKFTTAISEFETALVTSAVRAAGAPSPRTWRLEQFQNIANMSSEDFEDVELRKAVNNIAPNLCDLFMMAGLVDDRAPLDRAREQSPTADDDVQTAAAQKIKQKWKESVLVQRSMPQLVRHKPVRMRRVRLDLAEQLLPRPPTLLVGNGLTALAAGVDLQTKSATKGFFNALKTAVAGATSWYFTILALMPWQVQLPVVAATGYLAMNALPVALTATGVAGIAYASILTATTLDGYMQEYVVPLIEHQQRVARKRRDGSLATPSQVSELAARSGAQYKFDETGANISYVWLTTRNRNEDPRNANGTSPDEVHFDAYLRALDETRGSPLKASIQNARAIADAADAIGRARETMPLVCVSGERFRFREWYEVRREHLRALRQRLQQPRTGLDWARVPDGLALRFVPPPDVTAALHEAEDLRAVALGDAVRLVAGAPADARSEAALLAEQIHLELVGAVQDRWLPPQGEQLVVSAPETTRALARSAANILRALYGYKASPQTPSVGVDDAFFACVHGGAAARFALRHLAIVEATQSRAREWWDDPAASDARQQFANERTGSNVLRRMQARRSFAKVRDAIATREWTASRRVVVDGVCDAWVRFAQKHAGGVERLDVDAATSAAVGSFARVTALGGGLAARLAVASSTAALATVRTLRYSNVRDAIARSVGAGSPFAAMPASPPSRTTVQRLALVALAARRLDLAALRNAPLGRGVDDIVDALTRVAVDDADADAGAKVEHYFVGGGDDFEREPAPRLHAAVATRVVWLARLATACKGLAATMELEAPRALPTDAMLVKQRSANAVGLGRHPFVVTRDAAARRVDVWLAATRPRHDMVAPSAAADGDSLLECLKMVVGDAAAAVQARETATRSRALAFNADRLAAGLAIAAEARVAVLQVDAPEDADVTNVAAAALAAAIAPNASSELYLDLQPRGPEARSQADRAVNALKTMERACAAALDSGCTVATLSEVCVAFEAFV